MVLIELDPVDRITADAMGPPGHRTFFLQGRKGDRVVTVLVEKQQVQLLAASVVEILSRLGKETGQGPPEEAMGLEEPVVPEWRAGRISIGYEEDRDLILLEAEEVAPEEDETEATVETEGTAEDPLSSLGVELGVELEVVEAPEAGPEEEGDGDTDEDELQELEALERQAGGEEASRVRFWASREQMLSLARHGASVCAQGRPRCHLCGNPIDPEGHHCPALNGHRDVGG